MTDNEMLSIDLVVGPLDNFDDAVAFGDALYGLEGVTRLALNEFEGNRASFTFTARSLESVTESLTRMSGFVIGSVERAVDGTLQVRLGAASPATATFEQPAPVEPERYEAPAAPDADPFVPAPAFNEAAPVADPWRPVSEPVMEAEPSAETFSFATESAVSGGFDEVPAQTMDSPAMRDEFPAQAAGWPAEEPASVPPVDEPTPLYPAQTTQMDADQGSEDDPNTEVARVIEKLASELRETSEHLTALAAGLTSTGEPVASPAPEPDSPWREASIEPSDMTWDRDLPASPTASREADEPAASEEIGAHAAAESWDRPAQPAAEAWISETATAAQQPAPEEEEQRAWEAPRMPAIGAMAPIGGEGTSGESMTGVQNAQTIALATASGRRPSQVQLMASGFASFGIANSFIAAVRQIAGVRNVAIIELDQGRLKLTLDYFGSDSLETQLHQLRDFPHQVVRASAREIEIQLMAA